MAQKKKVKQKKQTFVTDLYIELIGIGLILLSILTLGQLGIIGTFLKRIFLFVFGEFFWVVALAMIINGGKMIFSRKVPTFFTTRQIVTI